MTTYEREQLADIREWLAEAPGPAVRTLGKSRNAAARMVQAALPTAALRLALDAAHRAALGVRDRRSILKRAGVDDLESLRAVPLANCDGLAKTISRRAVLLAGSSGALFGVAGAYGLAADVPSLLIQTLRTIHRIGLCYGEDCAAPLERRLPIAIFALASANDQSEKEAALAAIIHESQRHTAQWRAGVEGTAQRELAKEAAVFSLNNLAKSVARHLGWRKAAGTIPVAGALISGSVNAWYLYDVTRTARHVFQWRWLRDKYGALPGDPALMAQFQDALTHHAPDAARDAATQSTRQRRSTL